ncbi:MAG TPA: cyclopropane-fatty-acyl-phospholipid synthase family protein [Bryobacteraceae bacterium]|nr:cyclopropane-fatty-acyl-phospholipid synthase family protein [Bryobacteraceae bacterium]
MSTEVNAAPARSLQPSWQAVFEDGTARQSGGDVPPAFILRVRDEAALERILTTDPYSAAMAYLRGEFEIEGDLCAAIRYKGWGAESGWRRRAVRVLAHGARLRECFFQGKAQAQRHIRFHYDRSNEFYRLFLDARMVYSCAYFRRPDMTLEEAQAAKLDHICRKLDLRRGDRFLDIGCGWGALVTHAATAYGAEATGCTISRAQFEHASAPGNGCVRIHEQDYRDLSGDFDKIASVGMFEHVGRRRARGYFGRIAELLAPDGLFLNHAIQRAQGVGDDAASLFVRRRIFPGGELIHLHETIRAAEWAGLEVLDVENLRPHYARTCRLWEERLAAQREAALKLVDEGTFRAWRIWLAASSLSFEEGYNSIYQVLLSKRGARRDRWTRQYLYR